MKARVFRKALGMILVDIVIIIGIFVLQFRTDSNIIEKIGNLQVTLTKSESENDEIKLKNTLKASYNGINIYFDDQTPPKILVKNEKEPKNIKLVNWSREDSSINFEMTDEVTFSIEVTEDEPEAPLIIRTHLPKNVLSFYLPYNFAYNMRIVKEEGKKVILNDKKNNWSFSADDVVDGYMIFAHRDSYASYGIFDDTKSFTFDSLTSLAAAEGINYLNVITNFKNNLITSFRSSLSDNNFSEQAVVSYVAAMSEAGKYQQAVDDIPQSYKRSEQRTYLSAPYFNNLVNMNNILDQQIKTSSALISKAAYTDSLDIYTAHDLAASLCIHPNPSEAAMILEKAAEADIEKCSVSQATGILITFDDLATMNPAYAKILRTAADKCIERLTKTCSFENNILTISENDTFLSVIQGVETGIALLRFGSLTNNETYIKAGRVIVSSYISESSSFDLRTLVNLYPLIAYDNWYYPHFAFIHTDKKGVMWAWTCAKEIKYAVDEESALNLSITFPLGLTHYVIFKGIPEFSSIYIYNTAFRTDPRFETYNSSGYVYRNQTKTLLLKSKHKSEVEDVRMVPKTAASTTTKTTTTTTTTRSTGTGKPAGEATGTAAAGTGTTAAGTATTTGTGTASTGTTNTGNTANTTTGSTTGTTATTGNSTGTTGATGTTGSTTEPANNTAATAPNSTNTSPNANTKPAGQ
jgi:hypothetical protein